MRDDLARSFLDFLKRSREWPLRVERDLHKQLELWRAFREVEPDKLMPENWRREDRQRPYRVDPLAARISETWADLLYGDEPEIRAAHESNQDRLDQIVSANDLPGQLHRMEEIVSSEGEAWWRTFADTAAMEVPTIEFLSRLHVCPWFRGSKLLAVAFVRDLDRPEDDSSANSQWRAVEIQAEGIVVNALFRSASGPEVAEGSGLGQIRSLGDHPATENLPPTFEHDWPIMLCGRVLNKRGHNPRVGISDYAGIRDDLYALNEAVTIGHENARLTLKKRVVVPPEYLDRDGNFPGGADVIIRTETDVDPEKASDGFAQIEWSFDADAQISYIEHVERRILTRARVAPQLVGRDVNQPESGSALRARLLDTLMAASGKGRFHDEEVPTALTAAQLLDSTPKEKGGFGYAWTSPGDAPTVDRRDSLPSDEREEIDIRGAAVGSLIESRLEAIRRRHPDWTEEQVAAEYNLVARENDLPELPEDPDDPDLGEPEEEEPPPEPPPIDPPPEV